MANGAAGCGWEYQQGPNEFKCGFIYKTPDKDEFTCLKYNKALDVHRTTKHPFRCEECSKDAARGK